jgi:DNA-binding MarR family transcriptional regulator
MPDNSTQNSSEFERADKFLDLIRKLIVKATKYRPDDSAEAEKRLKRHLKSSDPGKTGWPVTFFIFCKSIYQKSSVTMGEISNELLTSPATATRVVDWWVKNGLVERLHDPDDKRLVRVKITEEGKAFHELSKEIAHKRIGEFLGGLNPEEQIIINLLLEKLLSAHENRAAG